MRAMFSVVASGILIGITFIYPVLWPVALCGAIPFIRVVLREEKMWRSAAIGLLFGCIVYGFALFALFWHTIPLTWTGSDMGMVMQYALVAAAWIYAVIVCAVATATWALFVYATRTRTWVDILLLPLLWVLTEALGSLFFSASMSGPGMKIGPHITLGFLGNVIADDSALLQLAALGGIYVLSLTVMMFNTFFSWGIDIRRQRPLLFTCILFICSVTWVCTHLYVDRAKIASDLPVTIAALHTRSPMMIPLSSPTDVSYMSRLKRLVAGAVGADIVILPEGSDFLRNEDSPSASELASTFASHPAMIIDSRSIDGIESFRQIEYYDSASTTSAYSYKRFLVPVGEYMPYAFASLAQISGSTEAEIVASYRHFSEGPTSPVVATRYGSIYALSCEEVLSPTLYARAAREGSEVLLNLGSLIWYHDSHLMYMQLVRAAKIRAVESHRYFIEAGDTSPSFGLDWFGRPLGETDWGTEGILTVTAIRSRTVTIYEDAGAFGVIMVAAFCTIILITWSKRKTIFQSGNWHRE